jgi:hypothetical protein
MPTRLSFPAFALVAVYFLIAGAIFGTMGVDRMFSYWTGLNDMHYFYVSAQVLTGGNADILYDPPARVAAGGVGGEGGQVFPFPATTALLLWPLTLTDIVTARYIYVGIGIACAAAVAIISYFWSRDPLLPLLVVMAHASLMTFYEALRFNQMAPVLSLLLCAAMLATVSSRSVRGGLLTALLVVKPSIAAIPLTLLLFRRGRWQVAAAAAFAFGFVVLVPLLLVGLDGYEQFLSQLGEYREEAFKLDGRLTAGAGWMLNWQGLLAKATGRDPSELLVYALDVLTLGALVRVWLRGEHYSSWLAAVLATLLVIPHSVWYDWAMLLGVAPFALYLNRSPVLLGLMLALHASVSLDSHVILTTSVFDQHLFTTPIFAAASLLFLAFAPLRKPDVPPETEAASTIEPEPEPEREPVLV